MRIRSRLRVLISAAGALILAALARAAEPSAIASRTLDVDGLKLHYVTGGHGPALILLHGYAETSRMWRPILPLLAERFTVIVPDLPGIGDSSIPESGLDATTAAVRIHELAKSPSTRPAWSATTSA